MSTLQIGGVDPAAMRLGSKRVERAMLNGKQVWAPRALLDTFNRPNANLDADKTWVDCGPSLDHKAAIVDGRLRIDIPDGLIDPFERISYMRYTAGTAISDDGYVETLVATVGGSSHTFLGEQNYATHVYAKVSNNGFSDGVGMWLAGSQVGIVVKRNLLEQVVSKFSTYSPGDTIRMVFSGREYTMLRNGDDVGHWTAASGQVVSDSNHRSLGIRVHGAKELFGPRRFSPSLDYVEYG